VRANKHGTRREANETNIRLSGQGEGSVTGTVFRRQIRSDVHVGDDSRTQRLHHRPRVRSREGCCRPGWREFP